jgi:hypothetical protein
VDSTPSQLIEAAKEYEYLCADSPEERKIQQLKMITGCGAKVGIRVNSTLEAAGETDELLDNMLSVLGAKKKEDANVIQG